MQQTTRYETLFFSSLYYYQQEYLLNAKLVLLQGHTVCVNDLLGPLPNNVYNTVLTNDVIATMLDRYIQVGRELCPLYEEEEFTNAIFDGYHPNDFQSPKNTVFIPRFIRKLGGQHDEVSSGDVLSHLENIKYKNVITIVGGPGAGKTTFLTNLAHCIKKNHPNYWVLKVNLHDYLDCFLESKKTNLDSLTLREILNSRWETELNDLEEAVMARSRKMIILLDGTSELCSDFKDLVTSLKRDCLKYTKGGALFLTASMDEQDMGLGLSYALVPFSEEEQVDCIITCCFNHNLHDCRSLISASPGETLIEFSKTLINSKRWLEEASKRQLIGIPLLVYMATVILVSTPRSNKKAWCSVVDRALSVIEENKKGSDHTFDPILHKKLSLVELYQESICSHLNLFTVDDIKRLNSVRSIISGINMDQDSCFYILALETILSKKKCDYFSCYKNNMDEIHEKDLFNDLIKKVYKKYRFIHPTFAEYFLAECICNELREYNNQPFLDFFYGELLTEDRFKLVRAFFDSFILTDMDSIKEPLSTSNMQRFVYSCDQNLIVYTAVKEGLINVLSFLFDCNAAGVRLVYGCDLEDMRLKGNHMLHYAVEHGHLEVVKFLLDIGVPIDIRNAADCTALHLATRTGNLTLVNLLVDRGLDVNCKDSTGRTALHEATQEGCLEMVECLIGKGADINSRCNGECTPLYIASTLGDLDRVKLLVENGAEVNPAVISNAVFACSLDVVKYLIENGADVLGRTKSGGTMLHALPRWRDDLSVHEIIEISALLLDAGVDINSVDNYGDSVLFSAIDKEYKMEFIDFLVSKRAHINTSNHDNDTPILKAISRNNEDIVKYLTERGARITENCDQNEVICNAVKQRCIEVVKYLGKSGVSLDISNKSGETALNIAILNNDLRMVKFLVKRGAKIDGVKMQPRSLAIAQYLMQNGAQLELNWHEAASSGDLGLVKYAMGKFPAPANAIDDVGGNLEVLKYLLNSDVAVDCAKLFFKAAANRDFDILPFLLEKVSRDVQAKNDNDETAFHVAVKLDHVDVLAYLLDQVDSPYNGNDIYGHVPLYYAIIRGNFDAVTLLCESDVDIEDIMISYTYDSPIIIAIREGYFNLVRYLAAVIKKKYMAYTDSMRWKKINFESVVCEALNYGLINIALDLVECDPNFGCKLLQLVKRLLTEPTGESKLLDAMFSRACNLNYLIQNGVDISYGLLKCDLVAVAVQDGDLKLVQRLINGDLDPDNIPYHTAEGYNFIERAKEALHRTGDYSMIKLLLKYEADANCKDPEGFSMLFKAMRDAHLDTCKLLVDNGADIQEEDEDGRTLLHMSRYKDSAVSSDKIKYLLEKGVKLKADKNGRSVLHDAISASYIDFDVVKSFVKVGVDLNGPDENGATPLDEAVIRGDLDIVRFLIGNGAELGKLILFKAIKGSNLDIVKYLVRNGADINAKDEEGRTLLHQAVAEKNLELVKFFTSSGIKVNSSEARGYSPLHEAASKNYFDLVKYLVESGASLHAQSISGSTLLHEAAASGFFRAVKFFCENSLDVNATDKNGCTPLYKVCKNRALEASIILRVATFLIEQGAVVNMSTRKGRTAFHEAASSHDLKLLKLLVANEAEINSRDEYGCTPLFAAVKASNSSGICVRDVIKFLVDSGADLDEKADDGRTVLHEACIHGDLGLVRFLVRLGMNINEATISGRTPLHEASRCDKLDVVEVLIEKGADIEAKTKKGFTALDEAVKAENLAVVEYFTKRGIKMAD